MLDITASEFILIALVILLVVGPKQVAETTRRIGRFFGQIKTEASLFKQGIRQEIDAAAAPVRISESEVKETAQSVEATAVDIKQTAAEAQADLAADLKEVRTAMDEVGRVLGSPRQRLRRRRRF